MPYPQLHIKHLHNHQVIQRERNNAAKLVFDCASNQDGILRCSVSKNNTVIHGFDHIKVGVIKNMHARCQIPKLPCGGPYTLTFTLDNLRLRKKLSNIYVGDLWVMAGQSNMQGIGLMSDALKPHKNVHMFSMRDEWKKAKDPINFCASAKDQAFRGQDHFRNDDEVTNIEKNLVKGVGPGLAFGAFLNEYSAVPIGLIPCAKGGSAMREWDYQLPKQREASSTLYGATMRRIQAAGGKIAGVIWSQGCSDANPSDCKSYRKRMQRLVKQFRKDLGQDVPWIMTQINGFYDTNRWNLSVDGWTDIRHQQAALPKYINKLACVSTIDLDLDDGIHISAKGQHRIGQRLAKAALQYSNYSPQKKAAKRQYFKYYSTPFIDSISEKRGNQLAQTNFGSYAIRIKGLNGKLCSDGSKVLGFTLHDKDGVECKTIYKSWLHGDEIIIQTELKAAELKRYKLYYGFGCTPICNITDSEDMALLAAGPFDLRNAT